MPTASIMPAIYNSKKGLTVMTPIRPQTPRIQRPLPPGPIRLPLRSSSPLIPRQRQSPHTRKLPPDALIQMLQIHHARRRQVRQLAGAVLDHIMRVHAVVVQVGDDASDGAWFDARGRPAVDQGQGFFELGAHDGVAEGAADGLFVGVFDLAQGVDQVTQSGEEFAAAGGYFFCRLLTISCIRGQQAAYGRAS